MIEGFKYQPGFLGVADETVLLDEIRAIEFHEMRMRGVTAKRRVIHYGVKYSFETFKASEGPPIPGFLLSLRTRAAEFAGVTPDDLAEAVGAVPPGAGAEGKC